MTDKVENACKSDQLFCISCRRQDRMEPLIGIVAQELDYRVDNFPKNSYCFIAASYVRFVQSAGAKVVPILIGKDPRYYREIVKKINGVLLPGGAISFEVDGYGGAGMEIYKVAKDLNDHGDYFPLYGICLGHQLLIHCSAGFRDYRGDVDNLTPEPNSNRTKLTPTEHFRSSKMFRHSKPAITTALAEKEILTFHHKRCVEKHIIDSESILDTGWNILSYSFDTSGKEFVAIVEAQNYPFYGTQFHPEKNLFELNQKIRVCTSDDAIMVSKYFADFFVSECKKNYHKFDSDNEKNEALIDNYHPVDSRHFEHSNYNECYFFFK